MIQHHLFVYEFAVTKRNVIISIFLICIKDADNSKFCLRFGIVMILLRNNKILRIYENKEHQNTDAPSEDFV